jgi:hypothetical protein
LPWDVRDEPKAGVFAFVNERARLKILVMPPESGGAKEDNQWIAKMIDGRSSAALKESIVSVAATEIDLVVQIEGLLDDITQQDEDFLKMLIRLQDAGLKIDDPGGIAAFYSASGHDAQQKLRMYLSGMTPFPNPFCLPGYPVDRLCSVFKDIGFDDNEAWIKSFWLYTPSACTA